jgi:hypothetical protein
MGLEIMVPLVKYLVNNLLRIFLWSHRIGSSHLYKTHLGKSPSPQKKQLQLKWFHIWATTIWHPQKFHHLLALELKIHLNIQRSLPMKWVVCLGMLDPWPSKWALWALLFWQMLCKHRESRLLSIIQPLPSKLALLFDKRFARRKNIDSLVFKLILRTLTIFGFLATSFVRSRWVGSNMKTYFPYKKKSSSPAIRYLLQRTKF